MSESNRTLEPYKKYADKELYERVTSFGMPYTGSALSGIEAGILLKLNIKGNFERTPENMQRLADALRSKNASLDAIVDRELSRVVYEKEHFDLIKGTDAFQKEYAEYSANYETSVIH